MTERAKHLNRWIWSISISLAFGIYGMGVVAQHLFAWIDYAYPVTINSETVPLKPFIDGNWIKVPSDITRDRECLAQSTVTLRRTHDYGAPIGTREDIVTLGLYNTTLTEVGTAKLMLWFRLFDDVPPGAWGVILKIQDDCGGIFDDSARKPRVRNAGTVMITRP
jgi:hypothetical protein